MAAEKRMIHSYHFPTTILPLFLSLLGPYLRVDQTTYVNKEKLEQETDFCIHFCHFVKWHFSDENSFHSRLNVFTPLLMCLFSLNRGVSGEGGTLELIWPVVLKKKFHSLDDGVALFERRMIVKFLEYFPFQETQMPVQMSYL